MDPVADDDDLASTPSDGDRELTPSPGSLGRPARISVVAEVVNIPLVWLDRLLILGHELPFDQGEAAVLAALSTGLERAVTDVHSIQVAIQLVNPLPDGQLGARVGARKGVHSTEPPKSKERLRAARIFPDARHERWVILPGSRLGALHFACEEDVFGTESAPHVQFMERAAAVVGHALARIDSDDRVLALQAELRAAEAQIVQAEKLASLGQIAAGMVHELNNPLTSIAAYTDFLLRRAVARAADDDVERLGRIAESANRMLRFTRDLISYARPPADVRIAVQINAVVDRALAFCEHEIVEVGVVVERVFDDGLAPVRGLPEQLAQVFVNLVTNACHAMAPGTSPATSPAADGASATRVLTISTTQSGEDREKQITVVVSDTGCGIGKENLALIFTPFFTTKSAGRGTGLGLSIVKKIVEGHGGEIRAESEVGVGTRFILTFPVA